MNNLDISSVTATDDKPSWRNSMTAYGLITITFHWTIALLFIAQLALGYLMSGDDVDPALQFDLFQYHKSLGFLVLALAIPRVLWSVISKKPHPPTGSTRLAHFFARIAHVALLLLTIAVPLAGWAVASSSTLQIPSYVFDLFVIPGLPLEISDTSEAFWTITHETLAYCAAAIVVLHMSAALWHHFILRDLTLRRMLPFRS